MNEHVQNGQFTFRLDVNNEMWIINVGSRNVNDVRYRVEALGPGNVAVWFEMTTTSVGKWISNTDELPSSIKDNLQQIGKTILNTYESFYHKEDNK